MTVAQPVGRPGVQLSNGDETDHRRQLAQAVNRINQGHLNCTLFVTLDPGVTETPVVDSRISPQTSFIFHPTTANAAADVASGQLYAVCTNGSAVIHHANNADTDRTFTIGMLG